MSMRNGPHGVLPSAEVTAGPETSPSAQSSSLQRLTALVLLVVLLSLAWMISVAYQPQYLRLFSVEAEVIIILALLVTALLLVSGVALLHTRS